MHSNVCINFYYNTNFIIYHKYLLFFFVNISDKKKQGLHVSIYNTLCYTDTINNQLYIT
jgi:hypothetical protein